MGNNETMRRLRPLASLALVIGLAAFAACGGSDKKPASTEKPSGTVSGNERSILATVDALQTASRKGDGQKVCAELFTPRLAKSVEAAAKHSCAQEVRRNMFTPDAEISVGRQIQVTGDRGTAVIREQNGNVSKLSFLKQSGQWRIDRVTPQKSG